MRAVISIGAGYGQRALIHAARQLGYKVVAVDRAPANDTLALLDDVIVVSTYDIDTVIELLLPYKQRYDFCAVFARTSGPALLTAAKVADIFGLPGLPSMFVNAAVSKSELRRQAQSLQIATPQGVCVTDGRIPEIKPPWVVKPDMPLVGKQNVYKVSAEIGFHTAYVSASDESYNDTVDVELFTAGLDVGYMAIVYQGKIEHGMLYDEFVSFQSNKAQGIGVAAPSLFCNTDIELYCLATADAFIRRWQYQAGFAFFSFRLSKQGEILLYEVNPGLCGDAIADQLLPALWPGFNPFVCEANLLLGNRPEQPVSANGQYLIIGGKLIRVSDLEGYFSAVSKTQGGSDIVAMSRWFLKNT
ncbi:MAG: hypothetical protein ACC707_05360 [Thiohalomonadales bacterium]